MEYLLWAFAYLALFVTLFWLQILLIRSAEEKRPASSLPSVSILIPAHNEEKTIKATITSLLQLNYPKKLLQIIMINDGSADNTASIARTFKGITLLEQTNKGKAAALNYGLKHATGELASCLDADSFTDKNSLKHIVPYFTDAKMGAVICAIRAKNTKRFLAKLQWLEYIFAAFMRKLMAAVNTLYVTPGVLSTYRTAVLKKLGGFDENRNNLTEDFEIALRLHSQGYKVKIETASVGYTHVPATFATLYQQRVRWYRGFIYNAFKYRFMFFNSKYGMMGYFQLPLAILSVIMLLTTFSYMGYKLLHKLSGFLTDLFVLRTDFLQLLVLPDIKRSLLNLDIRLWFPVLIVLLLVTYLFIRAHKDARESWRHVWLYPVYLVYYPYLQVIYWISAVCKETVKAKRKW